jgi:hypothetical protein
MFVHTGWKSLSIDFGAGPAIFFFQQTALSTYSDSENSSYYSSSDSGSNYQVTSGWDPGLIAELNLTLNFNQYFAVFVTVEGYVADTGVATMTETIHDTVIENGKSYVDSSVDVYPDANFSIAGGSAGLGVRAGF